MITQKNALLNVYPIFENSINYPLKFREFTDLT
jgi:hypothetical protein